MVRVRPYACAEAMVMSKRRNSRNRLKKHEAVTAENKTGVRFCDGRREELNIS